MLNVFLLQKKIEMRREEKKFIIINHMDKYATAAWHGMIPALTMQKKIFYVAQREDMIFKMHSSVLLRRDERKFPNM